MRKVEKNCEKGRSENAKLGTENHKTHDVKPKTQDGILNYPLSPFLCAGWSFNKFSNLRWGRRSDISAYYPLVRWRLSFY